MSEKIDFVIDTKQRRPACVLIQAAYGCDSSLAGRLFLSDAWLVAPNDDMYLVSGTKEEWEAYQKELETRTRAGEFQK